MISIVIPTYSNAAGLRACVESILKHTTADYELIIVANGAPPETQGLIEDLGNRTRVKGLWFNDAMGMTRASNEGLKVSRGEYVVLLNDDTVILGPEWLDLLQAPFSDPTVGLTGPQKEYDPNSGHDFLIFFCVMIRRELFTKLGYLDEAFNPGFGEDTDYCIRAERVGYKWLQVPDAEGHFLADKPNQSTLPEWKQEKMWVGQFPIYHDGEQTFGKLKDTNAILERNRIILRDRYNHPTDIDYAVRIDGWMAESELRWLAHRAKEHKVVFEIGSWHGRSSRALADNLPSDGKLYCIDTWHGSSGEPEAHGSAAERAGDNAFIYFNHHLSEHILSGKLHPVRMSSENAAKLFANLGLKADMIFIDGDHSYEGVKADIEGWLPLLSEGGLICGHDYVGDNYAWIGVKQAVDETFPDVRQIDDTSIWMSERARPRRVVIDAFPFNNELDLLEVRLAELDSVVDRFVLVEGTLTYPGKPKPLYFDENKARFAKYLHKITHIVVNDFPETDDPWVRERWQRDATMRALAECRDTDIILIGDADEIPRAEAVRDYDGSQGLCRLKQRLFYYYMDCESVAGWDWLKIAPYKVVRERTPCGVRYPPAGDVPMIENGGWHFSFMGGIDGWIGKIEATAHQEYNTPEFKDPEKIKNIVERGGDIFHRGIQYTYVNVDENYPSHVLENLDHFKQIGFLSMHLEADRFIAYLRRKLPEYFTGRKVLEVGSQQVNGSIRHYFTDCDYTGIDVRKGKGVDVVSPAHKFLHPGEFDVVVSTEMLEHDKHWQKSLEAMYANLKPGGLFILTCAAPGRPEHGTSKSHPADSPFTLDHYRNISIEDFQGILPAEKSIADKIYYDRTGEDLRFYGFKAGAEIDAGAMATVTAEISTKDRYFTTLPLAIMSVINQTRKPERLVLYDDGEQKDLREVSPYSQIFRMLDNSGIKWSVVFGKRQGQVANHQHALESAETEFIWRLDDDNIAEPTCLEKLLEAMEDEKVGAVAGLVFHPGSINDLPSFLTGGMDEIYSGLNIQWFQWNSGVREVDHLYSTFIYRVEAGMVAGGYAKGLSSVGHREETIFTHSIKEAGYKLIVTPYAKTWHLRETSGGIRATNDRSLWDQDERVFESYLKKWGVTPREKKVVVLDCGLGDHFALKSVLSKVKEQNKDKDLILAVCFPEVFEGEQTISIADARLLLGDRFDESNFYRWMWDRDWKKSLPEAFVEMTR